MIPPRDTCDECGDEVDVEEPATCYYTGGSHCGDCTNPKTGAPMHCFTTPTLCDKCLHHNWETCLCDDCAARRKETE